MTDTRNALAGIVGREHVSDDPESLQVFSGDHSFVLPIPPWFAVRPGSEGEVQEVVVWANATRTPLVPVSSGSPHFYGDTVPGAPGAVMVDLSRMNAIKRIDRRNRMAVIEPGVTYGQLRPELAKEGLALVAPLRPRPNKSVIGSLLERQPTLVPRYHYAFPEPLRTCGVVWGNGEKTYTGEAGYGPYSLEDQWRAGLRQVDPKGPAQTDFVRLLSGAQGTLGIVTWASVKCTLLPSVRRFFFVAARTLAELTGLAYRLQRLRLGEEVFLASGALLARLLAAEHGVAALKEELPSWVLVVGVAGRALLPEERADVQEKDISEAARACGLELLPALPGAATGQIEDALTGCSPEPYWKLAYRGDTADVFFLAALDKASGFVATARTIAEEHGYPAGDMGVYLQPQHQGVAHHCELSFPFDPSDPRELARTKAVHTQIGERLIGQGAYFSRPYGSWADLVYNRDAQSTMLLRKIKGIFDPNNVMNPGKLCF
ncbi:MAG: FAD-binding oxidoreductase [Thermoleophilia bacterium]|nr:FAD-binding oxidoreductase [Thermoleophilia bacterium]